MTPKNVLTLTSFLVAASLALFSWEKAGLTASPPGPARPDALGEISGRATFEGTPPALAEIDMSKDPVCAARHKRPVHVEDGRVNRDGALPNVFVYVKAGAESQKFQTPSKPAVLDQVGCLYSPHVLGIMVGQPLEIISSDATTHNIHAMPKDNPEW